MHLHLSLSSSTKATTRANNSFSTIIIVAIISISIQVLVLIQQHQQLTILPMVFSYCCCGGTVAVAEAYRPNNNSNNNRNHRVNTTSRNNRITSVRTTSNNNNNDNPSIISPSKMDREMNLFKTNTNEDDDDNDNFDENVKNNNNNKMLIQNQKQKRSKRKMIKAKMRRMKLGTSTAILEENNWMNILYNTTSNRISREIGFDVDLSTSTGSSSSSTRGKNRAGSGAAENDKVGKWVSSLLSDVKEKLELNTDDVSEKDTLILYQIRGGGTGGGGSGNDYILNHDESMYLVTTTTSSHDAKNDSTKDFCTMDSFGRSISLFGAGIVLIQSLLTFSSFDNLEILHELATRLLSTETAFAMQTIRKIISNFPEHGVVDVFSEYPTKDVVMAILALSRLQRAFYTVNTSSSVGRTIGGNGDDDDDDNGNNTSSSYYGDWKTYLNGFFGKMTGEASNNADVQTEYKLLADLAHYSVFAHAAYGWKMGLLSGKIHIGDLETLLRKTGIEEHDVIDTNWKSKTHLPAYFIVRDVNKKTIVLCIRGTLSAKDVLTDLCCEAEDFLSYEEEVMMSEEGGKLDESGNVQNTVEAKSNFRAHQGMVQAARGVSKQTYEKIRSELDKNPDYKLVLVGHSLGGGVAAVLGTIWRDTFPGLKVFAYGCPCVAPLDCYPTIDESVVSVVGEGDPFSCLSLGHLADTSSALSKLCENEVLRSEILNRTKTDVNEMIEEDINWCIDTLESLSIQASVDNTTEKFYPPGRVLHLKVKGGNFFRSNVNEATVTEVKPHLVFRDLKLHPRMFDLSLHVPHRYEVLLSKVWTNLIKRI